MPKTKTGEKYAKRYDEATIEKALDEIRSGAAIKSTARKFGLPRSTLQFRLSQKFKKTRPGPVTVLTSKEENLIENWIIECARKGFPRRKHDIRTTVQKFLDSNPRENPFKNNSPGEHWYKNFL